MSSSVPATTSQVRDALFTAAQSGYPVLEKRDRGLCDQWCGKTNTLLRYALNTVKYAQYEQDKRIQCKTSEPHGVACFTIAWMLTACRTVDSGDISTLCMADGLVEQAKKGKP